ncbi:MAG TPA: hypothetical protein DHU96_13945 [Actinobacteria bacterium]|nr:hypothetical protein [Actinomycetota bacterium]
MEAQPKQDGRNMIMVIGPHRRKSDTKAAPREGAPPAERPTRVRRAPAPPGGQVHEATEPAAEPAVPEAPEAAAES